MLPGDPFFLHHRLLGFGVFREHTKAVPPTSETMSDLPGNMPTSSTNKSMTDSGKTDELLKYSIKEENHVHDAQGVSVSCTEGSSSKFYNDLCWLLIML